MNEGTQMTPGTRPEPEHWMDDYAHLDVQGEDK